MNLGTNSVFFESTLPPTLGGNLVRRPIVDATRSVHAYRLAETCGTGGWRAALPQGPATRRPLFLPADPELLLQLAAEPQPLTDLVLEVDTLKGDDPEAIAALQTLLQSLHERGIRFAFGHGVLKKAYAQWLPLASFVLLDTTGIEPQVLDALLKFIRERTAAEAVATQVESTEGFERLRKLGVGLFEGHWFQRAPTGKASRIQPAQAAVIQLIDLLRREADIGEIEVLLKRDPSLAVNLLRAINVSSMGLSCEVTSLRHAVLILGQKRLMRWATMLLTSTRAAGTAPAVATTALVRGRLMELLAAELLPAQDCDNAFVAGVFSLLDVLLDMPMSAALASVSLPEPVANALLQQQGLLAPFLALTVACENVDDAAFAAAADALHLDSHQINWSHLQALAWADELAANW